MKTMNHHPDRSRAVAALGLAVLLSISASGLGLAAPAELAQGSPAPDFTLEDTDGKAHHLADLKGKQPVVLVFYRGTW